MVFARVLNGRVYRAAWLPLLFALAIAGFSLSDRPAPMTSNLAPEAFQGERAESTLRALQARYPDRRPGSPGDDALANALAGELRALGGAAGGGFAVTEHTVQAQTVEGSRALTTVVAQRPGTTGGAPIAILARRDALATPDGSGLSATAALLELARVFATSETHRAIVLVSTSGGSGGNAGARDFAEHAEAWVGGAGGAGGMPLDAAIVVGDLGGAASSPLFLGTLADAPGAAPELLRQTVAQAVRQQAGITPRAPALLDRLAQASFPLAGGEQAPLDARGIPAVMLQAGGELPGRVSTPPGAARLQGLGRAVLAAVYALDAGPNVAGAGGARQRALPLARKLLGVGALRLLVAALLLPPLLTCTDGLARQRRRRRAAVEPPQPVARWMCWVGACALPFLAAALLAIVCGRLGLLPTPYPPVAGGGPGLRGSALVCVLLTVCAFGLGWWRWPLLVRGIGLPVRPSVEPAGLALMLVLGALAVVVWAFDPCAALLLVPALHLWLLLADAERSRTGVAAVRGRVGALALVALGAAPLALLIAFYARQLGLGLGGVAHTALLSLASGRVGLAGAVLWSLALGCVAAALLLALAGAARRGPDDRDPGDALPEYELPPIRGPMSYAGPGSLGGTESALRR